MVGAIRLATTLPLGFILDRFGRRASGMFSASTMTLCMLVLSIQGEISGWKNDQITPVVALLGYILFSTIGMFPLPYVMNSEVYPQKAKGPCSGITMAFSMILSFILTRLYLPMERLMGGRGIFGFITLMSFLSIIFIFIALPETKGRPLWEIEEAYKTKSIFAIALEKRIKNKPPES